MERGGGGRYHHQPLSQHRCLGCGVTTPDTVLPLLVGRGVEKRGEPAGPAAVLFLSACAPPFDRGHSGSHDANAGEDWRIPPRKLEHTHARRRRAFDRLPAPQWHWTVAPVDSPPGGGDGRAVPRTVSPFRCRSHLNFRTNSKEPISEVDWYYV